MPEKDSRFPTTHWTLLKSVRSSDSKTVEAAYEEICNNYWFPIYSYLRRTGRNQQDAEDLTQRLFTQIVSENTLKTADRNLGKLRTFLLSVLNRMLSKSDRHKNAQKRGGSDVIISFDSMDAAERYRNEPVDGEDPESIYLHAWANNLLLSARKSLRIRFEKMNRLELFERLEPYLFDAESPKPDYSRLAQEMNSSEGAVRLVVHRLRKKFKECLEQEVGKTVLDRDDVETEMKWLREILSKR